MPKIRIGVIGCGKVGALHGAAIKESERAELVCACDPKPERARVMTSNVYSSLSKMLEAESLDAVTVATPDHLHLQPVLASLKAGCHVFCEKPLAMSSDEAAQMVMAAKRRGRFLAVNYNRRFGFGYLKAREMLATGKLGRINHALVHVTDGIPPARVMRQPHALLKVLLSHHIDLLRWFCGEVSRVQMTYGLKRNDAVFSFQFKSGATGALIGGWRAGQKRTVEYMEICGTQGVTRIEDVMQKVAYWSLDPDQVEVSRPNYFLGNNDFYDSLKMHVHHFIESLARNRRPSVTGEDGWRGLKIIESALQTNRRFS